MDRRSRRTVPVALAVTCVLGTAAWCLTSAGGTEALQTGTDVITVLTAALATVGCLRAAVHGSDDMRAFWRLLTVALGCWTAAELVWSVYDLAGQGDVPVPSLADAGYLAGVPLVVAALMCATAAQSRPLRRGRLLLDGVSAATAVALLGWVLVLGPVWRDGDLSTLGGMVVVAYPITDVVMVVVLVVTLMRSVAAHGWALSWLLAGILAMSVSDAVFTWLEHNGSYTNGDLVDVGWIVGYLAIWVGAHGDTYAPTRDRGRHESTVRARSTAPVVAAAVAPYLPIVVALTVIAGRADRLDAMAWWSTVLLIVLVLLRNVLVWLDRSFDARPTLTTSPS